MAYQNINFPLLKLKHNFTEENIAPVTILTNFAKEYRINRYSTAKRRFTYGEHNMKYTDWLSFSVFLENVGYQRDSFNFTHPFTGVIHKVRFETTPNYEVITMNSANTPVIVTVTDIILLEVFNE